MTKSVASEPNAEFKENDENQRVNEATAPETNVASDVASDGVAADGPTVTIKGVSGKKITGVVKVVKAKAKEAQAKTNNRTPTQLRPIRGQRTRKARLKK